MEHRYYPRVPIALHVELHHGRRLLGTYTTRDIGLEGLFLKTGPIDLRPSAIVEMQLDLHGRKHRLSGMVAHRSNRGIGVLLDQKNRAVFWAIFDLLKERRVSLKRSLIGIDRPDSTAAAAEAPAGPPVRYAS